MIYGDTCSLISMVGIKTCWKIINKVVDDMSVNFGLTVRSNKASSFLQFGPSWYDFGYHPDVVLCDVLVKGS